MTSYKMSEVQATGAKGTTYGNLGGVGLGYRMPSGEVVESGGNGWSSPACGSTGGLREFVADGGDGYMAAVRRMFCGSKKTAPSARSRRNG